MGEKKNHKIAVYSECPMSRFLRCALSRWQVVSGAYRHLSSRRASLSIHPCTHSHSMTSFFVKQWIRHVYVTDCITCHFKKVDRMDQQKLVTPTFQGWIFFHFDSWLLDSYRMRYLFPHGTRDARHNKNEKYRLFNASAMDNHNEIKNKTFFMQAWSKHNVKAC